MSLHINNSFAKKRGIGKKLILTIRAVVLEEHVDVVAGDFNGAAWRRDTSANDISITERGLRRLCLADASRPHTVVGSWCGSGYVGRRVWILQTPGLR